MSELEQKIDPVLYSSIEILAWNVAFKMVAATYPEDGDDSCSYFMWLKEADLPDGYTVWAQYDSYKLQELQELIEQYKDSIMAFTEKVLTFCTVIA